MRNPINRCLTCNKPIVRMKKVHVWDGFYYAWQTDAKYCSGKCRQRAYRRRVKRRALMDWAEKGV